MDLLKNYIPLGKTKHSLTENIREYGEPSLMESLGSFPQQRQMADKITERLFEKVYGIFQDMFLVNLEEFNDPNIKMAEITWERGNGLTEAFLKDISIGGTVSIQINVSTFDIRGISKKGFFKKISHIVAHELMHSNIYYKRLSRSQDIDDTPKYYVNAIKMYQTSDNLLFRYFAYALYNTFYQERQAMISQTATLIYNKIVAEKDIKKEDINKLIVDAVRESDSYEMYSYNLKVCEELKNNAQRKEELKKELDKYFIRINDIDKLISKIESLSEETINKIYKNAMLYYEENS